MEIPSTKHQLKQLIVQALNTGYISKSCLKGIETGNHYQSVTLGDTQTTGFRTDRHKFLDQINFTGKTVLDLGSNLGELSRAARTRGAAFVDGFEYDPYFIEIANLINALNGTTRVSFFRKDITDPQVYEKNYDIVLAFSVFSYVHMQLAEIAKITEFAFVLETHKLEENLSSDYLAPVSIYFPYYAILGESEWSQSQKSNEKRTVIVFSKEKTVLDSIRLMSP